MTKMKEQCAYCGRACKRREGYNIVYICEDGRRVQNNGTCDRWQHVITPSEFWKRCEDSLKRMENYQEGTYEITPRVPVGTNYRIIK